MDAQRAVRFESLMSVEEVRPAARVFAGWEDDRFERIFLWIVLASCLVHVGLAFVVTLSPARTRRVNAALDVVTVEVYSPEQFDALAPRPSETPTVPLVSPAGPTTGMIHATRLFAASALAAPGSKDAREALPTLRDDERILQLCSIEAMEQIPRWRSDFEPELVVAYAVADAEIGADRVHADGGAFRSRDRWYNLRFDCAVSRDHEEIVDFAFSVGDEIPESRWESLGLSVDTEVDDQPPVTPSVDKP